MAEKNSEKPEIQEEEKPEKKPAKPEIQPEKPKPEEKRPEQRKPEEKRQEERKVEERKPEEKKGNVTFNRAFAAEVQEVIGRTGTRGEAIQVRCKIMEGRDSNKVLRRNVKGPVQPGDILMLRETEIEAKPLNKAGRGGGS